MAPSLSPTPASCQQALLASFPEHFSSLGHLLPYLCAATTLLQASVSCHLAKAVDSAPTYSLLFPSYPPQSTPHSGARLQNTNLTELLPPYLDGLLHALALVCPSNLTVHPLSPSPAALWHLFPSLYLPICASEPLHLMFSTLGILFL